MNIQLLSVSIRKDYLINTHTIILMSLSSSSLDSDKGMYLTYESNQDKKVFV